MKISHLLTIGLAFSTCIGMWPVTVLGDSGSSLEQVVQKGHVTELLEWRPDGYSYLCLATEEPVKGETWSLKKLVIYEKQGTNLRQVLEVKDVSTIDSLSTLNGNLFVFWYGGSGGHIDLYALLKGKIEKTLVIPTKGPVELVDLNNDGSLEIIATEESVLSTPGKGIVRYPEAATIYTWNGTTYVFAKKVPWKQRLQGSTLP